jgi:hypothetical protein
MSSSNDELHRQMLTLLVKVMDLEGRTEFEKQVLAAWTAKDKNEMYKVINALNAYLKPTKISKYVSDTFEKPDIKFSMSGKLTSMDCSLEKFRRFLTEKQGASCWSWHHHEKEFMWCDTDMFNTECKRFRKLRKEGKIIIREDNNQTHRLGDVEWHCFVVTTVNGSMQMCPASLNLFGMDVDGCVYWFNKKINRDIIYNFLTK